MTHKQVRFKGEVYWLHDDEEDRWVLLSPLDHYDAKGRMRYAGYEALCSWAVMDVESGEIHRYGKVIGGFWDLEEVEG